MMEKVFFESSHGVKLCGILEELSNTREEVVILVHGYSSNKNGRTSTDMSLEFTKRSINNLRIDLSGCGESEGNFAEQTVSTMVIDVLSAIKFVEGRGYSAISLLGASGGGLAVMEAALACKKVSKLMLKAPVSDYVAQRKEMYGEEVIKEWREKGIIVREKSRGRKITINYSFFEDAKKHIMYEKVKGITCPTLIIHGDADLSVRLEQSQRLVKNFPDARLITLRGADHNLAIQGDKSLGNRLFADWFEGKELEQKPVIQHSV
jgi:uncharacterized protein